MRPLMYVWDNRAMPRPSLHSRRTDRIRKIVLESGAAHVGQWRNYERDVLADYRRAFGEEPGVARRGADDRCRQHRQRASGEYGEVRLIARDGTAL